MALLRNTFSWSYSRAELFRACPRQYFYHYYGSWGGWEKSADPKARTLYILRRLQTRGQWVGATVHNCLRWVLSSLYKTGQAPGEEQVLHQLGRRLQKDFEASGEGLYWENPRDHVGLLEHEYDDLEVADEVWQAAFEKALACVSNFFQSGTWRDLQALPAERWLEIEERASFDLDGLPVWVQLDCAHRTEDGGLRIYDWKTGKAEAEATRRQLALYSLYASTRWEIAPQAIALAELNLKTGEYLEHAASPEGQAAVRGEVAVSVAAMRAALTDPDANLAREESFAFTENEKTCRRCPFRRLCPRHATTSSE